MHYNNTPHKSTFLKVCTLLLIVIGTLNFRAQTPELPEKPKFQTSVYDEAGLLTPDQKRNWSRNSSNMQILLRPKS
jgi:hypothetical protein